MKMLRYAAILSLLFILKSQPADAQAIYRWADVLPGFNTYQVLEQNQANALVVSKKQVYVVGGFGADIDFNPGAGVDSVHGTGGYLARYDSVGQLVWAHYLGAVQPLAACKDVHGNYYIAGNSTAATDSLGLGMVPFTLANSGNNDMFIAKYDSTDHLVWAIHNGTAGCSSQIWGIAADASGNVYVTGQMNGIMDFDPAHPGTVTYTTSGQDGFVAKYDNTGAFVWGRDIHGYDGDRGTGICMDPTGNVIVTGYTGGLLYSAIPFSTTNGLYDTLQINGPYEYDGFVVKYSTDGAYVWGKAIGGGGNDQGNAVAADKEGNIYAGGYFTSQLILNPQLNAGGNIAGYLVKLDNNGNYVWSKMYGGDDLAAVTAIATDDSDRVYASGYFGGTAILNPANPPVHSMPAQANWTDIFTIKMDNAGNYKWDIHNYGHGATLQNFVCVDDSFSVYIAGSVGDTTYFDGTNPNGRNDYHSANLNWSPASFFAKYAQQGPANHVNGVNEVAVNTGISLYPNPAANEVTITSLNEMQHAQIAVYDMAGRVCNAPVIINANNAVVNTSRLAPGMYMVHYIDDNTPSQFIKFSKR